MKHVLIIIVIFAGYFLYKKTPTTSFNTLPTPTPPSQVSSKLSEPVAEFKIRITKKYFGTYITPQNSPIKLEKFSGFHNAVDVEYEDIVSDIPIYSIDDGQVIYSGRVNGYGGFIAIQYPQYIGIYGHLRPTSLIPNKTFVKKSDTIGVLGTGYSHETDGERKHLHFAILKGTKLNFQGYVQSETELFNWLNPLSLFN